MRRIIVLALSVLLALMMVGPIASAQAAPPSQTNLPTLSVAWWNWALPKPAKTDPIVGDYSGGAKCDGSNQSGVWFLAGELEGEVNTTGDVIFEATRNCTVPANTPLFFPVLALICGEPFGNDPADPTNPWTGDFTDCAEYFTDQALVNSRPVATVDGHDVRIQRVASGLFELTLPRGNDWGIHHGTFDVAAEGLWAYLPKGLPAGVHEVTFGGKFTNPFPEDEPGSTFTVNVTYNLTME